MPMPPWPSISSTWNGPNCPGTTGVAGPAVWSCVCDAASVRSPLEAVCVDDAGGMGSPGVIHPRGSVNVHASRASYQTRRWESNRMDEKLRKIAHECRAESGGQQVAHRDGADGLAAIGNGQPVVFAQV